MRIGKVESSIITEKGDINNPILFINNKKYVIKKYPFCSGFISGIITSILATLIYELLIKPFF